MVGFVLRYEATYHPGIRFDPDPFPWDLARLESGQTGQRFEMVSPETFIRKVVPHLQPLVEANDARFVTDTSAEGKGSEFNFDLPAISKGAKA